MLLCNLEFFRFSLVILFKFFLLVFFMVVSLFDMVNKFFWRLFFFVFIDCRFVFNLVIFICDRFIFVFIILFWVVCSFMDIFCLDSCFLRFLMWDVRFLLVVFNFLIWWILVVSFFLEFLVCFCIWRIFFCSREWVFLFLWSLLCDLLSCILKFFFCLFVFWSCIFSLEICVIWKCYC